MSTKTRWISLVAGFLLFFLGVKRLYQEQDWVLFILSSLIIAFSALALYKGKQNKEPPSGA